MHAEELNTNTTTFLNSFFLFLIMITKDMSIADIVEKNPETMAVFMKHGMHCIGCIASQFETLEEGLNAHGIDVEQFMKEINAVEHSD